MARPGRLLGGLAAMGAALWAVPARAAAGDSCAEAIEIATLPFSSDATTCGAGNDFTNDVAGSAVCSDLPLGYAGEDVVYKFELQQGNRIAVDLTMPPGATGDLALFLVRKASCADPDVCTANSVDLIGAGVGPERIKPPAQGYPPGTYYLIVDSALPAGDPAQCGAYHLEVTGHLSQFCGNGIIDPGEACDDGNASGGICCSADCHTVAPAGTNCRQSSGDCDVAEVCDGNGACAADGFAPAGTPCRAAAGPCDKPELCTGGGPQCPANLLVPFGTPCRASAGICDPAEVCQGNSVDCPVDQFLPAGTICASSTACRAVSRCGGGASCVPGQLSVCDDGDLCTNDSCNALTGCVFTRVCGADAGAADAALADGAADASEAQPGDRPVMVPPPLSDAGSDVSPPLFDGSIPDRMDAQITLDAPKVPVDAGAHQDAELGTLDVSSKADLDERVDGAAVAQDAGPEAPVADGAPGGSLGAEPNRFFGLGDGSANSPMAAGCSCQTGTQPPLGSGAFWPFSLAALLVGTAARRWRRR